MIKTPTKDFAKAIYASAKNKSGEELHKVLQNSVEIMAKRNLLTKSGEILEYLEEIGDKDQKIIRAKVLSKEKISEEMKEKIEGALKRRYQGEEVILKFSEDPTLIGGIRIETKNEVIDMSLKNKIGKLQEYLLEN